MSQNFLSQYGSSAIKFDFQCGGICKLRVTDDIKQKFSIGKAATRMVSVLDPVYRAELTAKAYQHFNKQKEQKQLIQEEKRAQEKRQKEEEKEKEQEEMLEREDDYGSSSSCSVVESPLRSRYTSRVVVDGAMIRVEPKNDATHGRMATARNIPNEEDMEAKEEPGRDEGEIEDSESENTTEKWSVQHSTLLLDTYQQFKPQFDEPYSKKIKIYQKHVFCSPRKNSPTAFKEINSLKRTWRLLKRPGADSKGWRWTEKMNEIFGSDPTIQLLHVAEVNDGGSAQESRSMSENSTRGKIGWVMEMVNIEKERVQVLKEMAPGQEKNAIFDRLSFAIEKLQINNTFVSCIKMSYENYTCCSTKNKLHFIFDNTNVFHIFVPLIIFFNFMTLNDDDIMKTTCSHYNIWNPMPQ
ncbi:hypothetical protein GHT06_013455 [Daphnia sinensis]|uniref:Uncharacterized protein n=1 Tax=Daphnia sinensis TaxID=1820382 RepID=A0AAD5KTV8_9CRUS|nr:hypothetical protein GHT06_013455 [Daphnia sinensis]